MSGADCARGRAMPEANRRLRAIRMTPLTRVAPSFSTPAIPALIPSPHRDRAAARFRFAL
jgi:hypothetical protein